MLRRGIKVTSIPIGCKVNHELLAAMLARYSRSNDGIDKILLQVDKNNIDRSIDKIFKFIDYGHASIGGLTSGIPIVIDNVSMYMAYKLFEISQMCDGQESSTRYITLNKSKIPQAETLGIPSYLIPSWNSIMERSFNIYELESEVMRIRGEENPERVRIPKNAPANVATRFIKNYVLDRTRYFIPFATQTNIAMIQSARMWAQTLSHLSSMQNLEAQQVAAFVRKELEKYTPRLIKHSYPEKSYIEQCKEELEISCDMGLKLLSTECKSDDAWVHVDNNMPSWLQQLQSIDKSLQYRQNRYGYCGNTIRRMRVTFGWGNIAIAELRDLNRHRTGHRYTPLIQSGFYTPPEINIKRYQELLDDQAELLKELMRIRSPAYVYALLLGSQTPFEHSTHADKFIYQAELRTGTGAHFKYAEHMHNVLEKFYEYVPQARTYVKEGSAEPE